MAIWKISPYALIEVATSNKPLRDLQDINDRHQLEQAERKSLALILVLHFGSSFQTCISFSLEQTSRLTNALSKTSHTLCNLNSKRVFIPGY